MINIDPANPRGIVWLASFPRSGNTWTRLFLMSLQRIVRGEAGTIDINHMDRHRSDVSAKAYARVLGRPLETLSRPQIASARRRVLQDLVETADGIALVKTHSANTMIFGATAAPTDLTAGAVYLIRNPLDVAISVADFRGLPLDDAIKEICTPGLIAETTEDQVFTLMGSWSQHVATWTTPERPNVLVMRYEDMVADPDEAFGRIATHLRIDHTPEQLSDAIAATAFDRLRAQEDKSGFTGRSEYQEYFFRQGKTGQWRDAMSDQQVARVVEVHRAQMERFGYWPL